MLQALQSTPKTDRMAWVVYRFAGIPGGVAPTPKDSEKFFKLLLN
jgi:hypothetical protein